MIPRKQLWSACLGNFFEHYDTALFGFLSSFLAPLIFPKEEPIIALILTYAMIPLGMLARPFGSLIFGYIGDMYGRRYALFLTLGGMSIISGLIAVSPTYLQVGILAPLLFCLGRILQNFFSAGETMGGAIFLLENTPEHRHDLLSGLYGTSTIGGILLASAGVSFLSYYQIIDPGWRFLYVCGCITGLFGCMMRSSSHAEVPSQKRPLELSIFWTHRKELLLIAISAGFSYANYSIALILMNGFIPLVSPLTKGEIMSINTALLVLDFCMLPLFGLLASKISREKLMLFASCSIILCATPLFMLLQGANLMMAIGIRICFVIFGVAFAAPFHAWAQQLIAPPHRYAIISFGYALGSQAIGGPTAAIALWSFQKTGMIASASWYWIFLAVGTTLAIVMMRKPIPKVSDF